MIISLKFLFIALISSLFHLDTNVFGQFMLSRPIVCGPIVGYIFGALKEGILIGVTFELIYISLIPVGIKIPPDHTAATVFSVICSKLTKCVILGISLGVVVGILYRQLDILARNTNSILLNWVDTAKAEVAEARVNLLVVYGVIVTYFRTLLFYLIVFPIFGFISVKICEFSINLGLFEKLKDLIFILPAIGIGIGLSHFTKE